MKKRRFILLFLLFLFCIPQSIFALDYPKVNSKIVEIYDLTNQEVVYEIDSKKQTSIASLTKIATTITAIELISDLDEEVVITHSILSTVRWDASKAGLQAGDKLSYRDLLYASMLPSGADATNAIAILSSGSIDKFVEKMNQHIKKIGLKHTHFVNVTGLDAENHYSTADDIRILLSYALKNDLFRKIYTTKEYTLQNGLTVHTTILKYNTSSNADASVILGSKTGYTGEAGYCLSSLSDIHSHEFLVIVLNAEHIDNQYYNIVDTIELIQFLMDHYDQQILIKKDDLVHTIPVQYSNVNQYEIRATQDVTWYLPSDYDPQKIKIQYDGLDHISFLNKKGSKIGTISYYYDNHFIMKETILLKKGFSIRIEKIIRDYYYVLIMIVIVISLLVFKKRTRKKKKKGK